MAQVETAQSELSDIDVLFTLNDATIDIRSKDPRRHSVTFADGRRTGFSAHLNRRRKALRDWLRKWGPGLKSLGYSVVVHEDFPQRPMLTIIQDIPDSDEEAAQLENQEIKKFFDPKRMRSKRLGKTPRE